MSENTIEFGQPSPVANQRPASWELVIDDMRSRDSFGRKKYGTPLQPFNGRDSLKDAYEEVLDLCVYLRNAIEERDLNKNNASKLVQEFINSPALSGKNLAQATALDIRDLLRDAGL